MTFIFLFNNFINFKLEIPFVMKEKDLILKEVSQMTHGFVATDLQYLCTQVAMNLIQEISNKTINKVWKFCYFKFFFFLFELTF